MAGEISGVVTDINNDPVQGATVYAIKTDMDTSEIVGETVTDSSGNYLFDVPYGGEFTVVAEWNDGGTTYNSRSRSFVSVGTSDPLNVTITGGAENGTPTDSTLSYNGFSLSNEENLPVLLEDFGVDSREGLLLVNGGLITDGGGVQSFSDRSFTFDGSTWTELPTMPTGKRGGGAAISSSGDFYSIAGADTTQSLNSDICYVYDGSSWSSINDLPQRLSNNACVGDSNGNIYSSGGGDSDFNQTDVFYQWDGSTWNTLPSMANTRRKHKLEIDSQDNIYAIGGENNSSQNVADIEVYDGSSWSVLTSMPTPVYGHSSAVTDDGDIYVIGGNDDSDAEQRTFQIWDGSSWSIELILDNPLTESGAGVI